MVYYGRAKNESFPNENISLIKSDHFLNSFASIWINVTRFFFCKILIKKQISYIFTSTNVRDVHIVYCICKWMSAQAAMFCVSLLIFFQKGPVKNGRENDKGQHVMTFGNCSVFFSLLFWETQTTDHIRLHCATWHFHFVIIILVKLSSKKWKKKYLKWILDHFSTQNSSF